MIPLLFFSGAVAVWKYCTLLSRAAEKQKEMGGVVVAFYKQATTNVVERTSDFEHPGLIPSLNNPQTFSIGASPFALQYPAMANTYSQIYLQVVFAVEGRQSLIHRRNKEELHKYVTGIVTEREQKLLAIHCMPDHTHILIGLRPSMALSDLVHDVKIGSANFVNRKRWVVGRFGWQEGFGAFSYGHSQLTRIIRYVQNQEQHHTKLSFREEYLRFLKKYEIDHDERYIFKPVE